MWLFLARIVLKSKGFEMKRGLLNTAVAVLGLAAFIAFAAYWLSIPWRNFDHKIIPPPEIIQQGRVSEVWIDEDTRHTYVNVLFKNGTQRKCTISTVGLYRSAEPEAMIGKINHGYRGWDHMAMDIGLPSDAYWHLRWAGWTPWRHQIRIEDL